MSRTRVFLGGLAYRCTERDIEKFFRKYGRIKEIALKNGFAFVEFDDYRDAEDAIYELNGKELLGERVSVERARGTPRGSDQYRGSGGAGQRYSSSRRRGSSRERGGGSSSGRYQSSRRDDNGRSFGSSSGGERYGPPQRTDYRVYVENLSSRVSWQDLKDYMRQEGCEVAYADAHKEHRNEAIVEFVTHQDMKTALQKLDGMELNGRKIRLIEDKRRPSRSSSRSRSRSKRRTRSRSPRSSRSKSKSKSRSRSRSRSGSVAAKRSKSRSRSVSKPRNGKSSRSRSDERASKSRSRSVSKPRNGDASRSRSRSRSRSAVKTSKSRSRSASQQRNDDYAD